MTDSDVTVQYQHIVTNSDVQISAGFSIDAVNTSIEKKWEKENLHSASKLGCFEPLATLNHSNSS